MTNKQTLDYFNDSINYRIYLCAYKKGEIYAMHGLVNIPDLTEDGVIKGLLDQLITQDNYYGKGYFEGMDIALYGFNSGLYGRDILKSDTIEFLIDSDNI